MLCAFWLPDKHATLTSAEAKDDDDEEDEPRRGGVGVVMAGFGLPVESLVRVCRDFSKVFNARISVPARAG